MVCSIQSDNKKEHIRISGLVGGILHMIIKKSYDTVKWMIIDEIFCFSSILYQLSYAKINTKRMKKESIFDLKVKNAEKMGTSSFRDENLQKYSAFYLVRLL